MKFLKVFISIILGIVMFACAVIFCAQTSVRTIFSGDSLGKIFMEATEKNGEINLGELLDQDSSVSTEELEKALDEIDEYVSKKELYNSFGDLASQSIKYFIGAADEIDTTQVKKLVSKIAKKYSEKTGETINIEEINKEIDKARDEAINSVKNTKSDELEKIQLLRYFFDNKIYYGVIAIFCVNALLIFLIFKSIKPVLIHLIIITVLIGIGNTLLFVLTKIIPTEGDAIAATIMNGITSIFGKITTVCGIALVLWIVLLVIANKAKKE